MSDKKKKNLKITDIFIALAGVFVLVLGSVLFLGGCYDVIANYTSLTLQMFIFLGVGIVLLICAWRIFKKLYLRITSPSDTKETVSAENTAPVLTHLGRKTPLTEQLLQESKKSSVTWWRRHIIIALILLVTAAPVFCSIIYSNEVWEIVGGVVFTVVIFGLLCAFVYSRTKRVVYNSSGRWSLQMYKCESLEKNEDEDGSSYYVTVANKNFSLTYGEWQELQKDDRILCLVQEGENESIPVKLFPEPVYDYGYYGSIHTGGLVLSDTKESPRTFYLLCVGVIVLGLILGYTRYGDIATTKHFYESSSVTEAVVTSVERDSEGEKQCYASFNVGGKSYDRVSVSSSHSKGDVLKVYVNEHATDAWGKHYNFDSKDSALISCYVNLALTAVGLLACLYSLLRIYTAYRRNDYE